MSTRAVRPWTSSQASDVLMGFNTAGGQLFEVVQGYNDGGVVLSWKGQLLRLFSNTDGSDGYTVQPCGNSQQH